MKIREIDAFDLYGDGTLVIKTNMEKDAPDGGDGSRYAWHIMRKQLTIFKIPYQVRPWTAWQIPKYGEYLIKAFVKNADGERTRICVKCGASL